MTGSLDALMIDVRANTQQFAQDVAAMRGTFDNTLVDGFDQAGNALERGLLRAIRKGSLGFEDLKKVAFNVIDQIAAQAIQGLFSGTDSGNGGLFGGGSLNLGAILGAALGLPGRATGGPVSPNRPFMVGERGPELFVPTAAGRIETGFASAPRDVRVSIQIAAPSGTSAPQALQRSSRQVASAVRRALSEF